MIDEVKEIYTEFLELWKSNKNFLESIRKNGKS